MTTKPVTILALLLFAFGVSAIGQTLMNETQLVQANESMPTRGMTMELVEASFGSPASRRAPVGDPPITRWEYQNFVVYFEYKRVIHSVSKRPSPQ